MECKICGNNRSVHNFPSGLTLCLDCNGNVYRLYIKNLRSVKTEEDMVKFVDYWKYLCKDIDNRYDVNKVKEILDSKLSFLTDKYIVPSNNGNTETIKYVNLLYPKMLSVLASVVAGDWTGGDYRS